MRLFVDDKSSPTFLSTIGVDFKVKDVKIGNKLVKVQVSVCRRLVNIAILCHITYVCMNAIALQIWDTAGQERFTNILSSYLRGAQGIILVYDVTNRQSYESIRDAYLPQVESRAEANVCKVLIGHGKADSHHHQKVSCY